jgi:hypothetical protein
MNQHEILQSFWRNADGSWTPSKVIAVAGVQMEPGVRFRRGHPVGGIDVAAFLDDLATNYPLSIKVAP